MKNSPVNMAATFDPLLGWTEEKVKAYVENTPLMTGDHMLIHNRQKGYDEYILATVKNPSLGKQQRVLLDTICAAGGATFYKTGINYFHPKGRSRMLPPAPEIVALIKGNPEGKKSVSMRHNCNALTNWQAVAA